MDLKFLHRDLKFQQQSNTLRDVYCRGDLYYISPLKISMQLCSSIESSYPNDSDFLKMNTLYTESHTALNLPAKYKFYTKYELSNQNRFRAVTGL